MERREFLKKTILAGVAGLGLLRSLDKAVLAETGSPSEIFVAHGAEPPALLSAALKAYGGLARLIKPGSTVVIKANFSWYGPPEQGCNTNPDLLAALVKACLAAGARKVRVVDLAIDPAAMCLKTSGIEKAVKAAGGETVNLASQELVQRSGILFASLPVYKEAAEASCLINLPVLKSHGSSVLTGAMKNLMGLTPWRNRLHSRGLDEGIVDLNRMVKPHLHLIDAYRVLLTNGPQGPGKILLAKELILTHDPVAGDAYGATLLGQTPGYLSIAAEAGLGIDDLKKVKINRIKAG